MQIDQRELRVILNANISCHGCDFHQRGGHFPCAVISLPPKHPHPSEFEARADRAHACDHDFADTNVDRPGPKSTTRRIDERMASTWAPARGHEHTERRRAKRYAHSRFADSNLRNGIKRNRFWTAPNMTVLWSETGRAKRYAHCHFWDKILRTHRLASATCVENLPGAKTTRPQTKQTC